jgi:hypothetical protein
VQGGGGARCKGVGGPAAGIGPARQRRQACHGGGTGAECQRGVAVRSVEAGWYAGDRFQRFRANL